MCHVLERVDDCQLFKAVLLLFKACRTSKSSTEKTQWIWSLDGMSLKPGPLATQKRDSGHGI